MEYQVVVTFANGVTCRGTDEVSFADEGKAKRIAAKLRKTGRYERVDVIELDLEAEAAELTKLLA